MAVWSQLMEEPLRHCRDISRENKLLVALGAGAVSLGLVLWWTNGGGKKLPPGPRGLPWVGAIHQLSDKMHLDCVRLRKKYGDIFSFKIGTDLWVVVNGYPAIRETFIRRGEEFAGRPQFGFDDITKFDEQIFSKDYNEEWKKNKKFAMVSLRNFDFGSPKLENKLNQEIGRVIEECRNKPNGFCLRPLLEKASARVISSIVLGGPRPLTEEELDELMQLSQQFFDTQGQDYLVAAVFLPTWLLKLLYKKQIKGTNDIFARIKEFMIKFIQEHQQTLDHSNPRDVMDLYISQRLDKDMTLDQVASTIMVFIPDPILTLTQALDSFFLNVIKDKQVQEELHKELDRVVGKSGQVTMGHKPELLYLQATIYETYRYAPLAPLSAPHKPTCDTTLFGYDIPENIYIVPSIHSVHKDPVTFPNPDVFDPGHFLDEGQIVKAEYCIPFSVGRRMCMGEAFAKLETFLFLANLMHEFEFSFPKDQPEPEEKYKNFAGIFFIQEPFQICVKPRQ